MSRRIALILTMFVIGSICASAQQSITMFGGVQMELQDSYAVSAGGMYATYYRSISRTVGFGGSIGYSDLKEGWYVPVAFGLQYRPIPFGISPLLGIELGTSFRSLNLNADDNPRLLSPQVGVVFPLAAALDLKLVTRADVMTRNGDWLGYLWYSAGIGYSW